MGHEITGHEFMGHESQIVSRSPVGSDFFTIEGRVGPGQLFGAVKVGTGLRKVTRGLL